MDAAYDDQVYVDDRTIDSHIKRLRRNSGKLMASLMRSKRSMASAIATTRPSNRRRDLWTSRIARLIFAWNIVGFAVLTLGALLLSELRASN